MINKILFSIAILCCPLLSQPVKEPYSRYQLLIITLNDKNFVLARCNTETGEAKYRLGNKWHKAVEENPIENSNYLCVGQAYGTNSWLFVRMDLNNGRIWTLQNEIWRVALDL